MLGLISKGECMNNMGVNAATIFLLVAAFSFASSLGPSSRNVIETKFWRGMTIAFTGAGFSLLGYFLI
jgi:hypothetical protein